MKYVLGVDQGATKTVVVLADENGNILSSGTAPGANHAITGLDYAIGQIRTAILSALSGTQIVMESIAAIGVGITGADFDSEYHMLHDELYRQFGIPVTVVNDCMIALRAESKETGSAIICGGTGLNIGLLGRNGKQFILGYYIDDWFQGGEALGSRMLRAITDAELGVGPPTLLTERALRYFGEKTVDGLLERLYTKNERKNMKFLVPDMMDCALLGDEAAQKILEDFAAGCADYAIAGMRRCDMLNEAVTVYFSGGIFKDHQLLSSVIAERISQVNPQIQAVDAQYEPVVGAMLLGLELLYGDQLPARVTECVHNSAKHADLIRNHGSFPLKPSVQCTYLWKDQ